MPNTDISDLHGIFPTSLRWNAEMGVLGYSAYDEVTGEQTIKEIELGSSKAKFVMDLHTRARGYGSVRQGFYDMRLTPVETPAPEWPGEDYKPAIGCWLWNPPLGELRLETNQKTLLRAVSNVWDQARTFKEAAEGLIPIIHFTDRREQPYPAIGRTFWCPIIIIITWVPREKVPPFALREPTVKPPPVLDSQVRFALLEAQPAPQPAPQRDAATRTRSKQPRKPNEPSKPAERGALDDFLDDEIPEL